MKKTASLTSFFVLVALFSFAGMEQVFAEVGSVTLPGFGKATDALNKAVTPSNIENLGGSRNSGLVPCGYQSGTSAAQDCQFNDFIVLIKNFMNFALFVFAMPLAAVMFAWNGWFYMYYSATGQNVSGVHKALFQIVWGLALAIAAWLIVNAIVIGFGVGAKYNFLGTT